MEQAAKNALDDLRSGTKTRLSAPQAMVWHYFQALRRRTCAVQSVANDDEMKEDVALCLVQAVAVVETFLNVSFRVLVDEPSFAEHKARVLKDIERHRSLEHKLRVWPAAILGKGIDFEEPEVKAFLALKERRNALMHFSSSHESVFLRGISIHGLADITVFDQLRPADAIAALEVVEGMISVLLHASGISEENVPHALHSWTGKVALSP